MVQTSKPAEVFDSPKKRILTFASSTKSYGRTISRNCVDFVPYVRSLLTCDHHSWRVAPLHGIAFFWSLRLFIFFVSSHAFAFSSHAKYFSMLPSCAGKPLFSIHWSGLWKLASTCLLCGGLTPSSKATIFVFFPQVTRPPGPFLTLS